MTWPTHTAFAISGLWLFYAVQPEMVLHAAGPLLLGAAFGSLLPDLDAPSSKLQRLAVLHTEFRPFGIIAEVVRRTARHRGWTHSPCGLLLAALLGWPIALTFGWGSWCAVLLGYASHLVADALTPSGISGLHSNQRLRLLPRNLAVATGSAREELLFVLCACASLGLLLMILASGTPSQM